MKLHTFCEFSDLYPQINFIFLNQLSGIRDKN